MNIKDHNAIEIEVLRTVPKEEQPEFIEKCWQKMRDLLEEHGEFTARDIIEALTEGYKGL